MLGAEERRMERIEVRSADASGDDQPVYLETDKMIQLINNRNPISLRWVMRETIKEAIEFFEHNPNCVFETTLLHSNNRNDYIIAIEYSSQYGWIAIGCQTFHGEAAKEIVRWAKAYDGGKETTTAISSATQLPNAEDGRDSRKEDDRPVSGKAILPD
jgi:hypothetical protein